MKNESALDRIQAEIIACERCPRLRAYCTEIARTKKRAFRDQEYWGRPVPGFGDTAADLWILGLAPAAHGANRTGRMFTGDGDGSGLWVYRSLHRIGFANQVRAESVDDGLRLTRVFISAAARCAPPDNRPTNEERRNCFAYLVREDTALGKPRTVLALGRVAFETALAILQPDAKPRRARPAFAHRAKYEIGTRTVIASYHPSRQNTQTGKLTREAWEAVFDDARAAVQGAGT